MHYISHIYENDYDNYQKNVKKISKKCQLAWSFIS